jgi:hypothetical protein
VTVVAKTYKQLVDALVRAVEDRATARSDGARGRAFRAVIEARRDLDAYVDRLREEAA